MGDERVNRRDVLKLGGAIGLAGVFGATGVRAQEKPKAEPEICKEPVKDAGWRLTVDIPTLPCFGEGVTAVEMDPIVIDPGARLYGPGAAHWGQARFASLCAKGAGAELEAWFEESVQRPRRSRVDIVVTLSQPKGGTARTYTLHNCFPVSFSRVNLDTDGGASVQRWALEVRVDRIEMK